MSNSTNNVVNLNQARKKKTRAAKEARAKQNRAKFGRTKAEKRRDDKTGADHKNFVDDHKSDGAD